MDEAIAIIIPAYKGDFLSETLESVLAQQDTNYHIYIFNDNSPDKRIDTIIHSFTSHPKVTYHRFVDNLGGKSLPAHWNRCIEHTRNESWIWLFSDDDLMDPDCLSQFRSAQHSYPSGRLFRFNTVKFTDETILKQNRLPSSISLKDWLRVKFDYQAESYVVEYIFHRSLFEQIGGFADFPLGWCADDWFWIETLQRTDLITVADALVYWRYSNQNISGSKNTVNTARMKMAACCLLIEKIQELPVLKSDSRVEFLLLSWVCKQFHYLQRYLSAQESAAFKQRVTELLPLAADIHL